MQKMDKIKGGKKWKKLEKESHSETESQEEVKDHSNFIDNLPPEMMMEIFNYLDTKTLVVSRLVSRKWNNIARELLQSRGDFEALFTCHSPYMGHNIGIVVANKITNPATSITKFEDSKETPLYNRFCFKKIAASAFKHCSLINFISNFGDNIKCLKLVFDLNDKDDGTRFAEELRHLILYQLPNLQELGLRLPSSIGFIESDASRVKLFPKSSKTSNSTSTSTVCLPNLKVIYLNNVIISQYTTIVTDLLRASTQLQKVQSFYVDGEPIEHVLFLHQLGKLACLFDAKIKLSAKLLSEIKERSKPPLDFKLKTLKLEFHKDLTHHDSSIFWSDASKFMSNTFKTSKDTLRELDIEPIGFLPGLCLPKFNKLIRLSVDIGKQENFEVLPSGLNLRENFPVLTHLVLKHIPWKNFSPYDECISCIPNLKSLLITGRGMTEEAVVRISEVCPNLKEFEIDPCRTESLIFFPRVGTAIWTYLKQLESLKLYIDIDATANTFPATDSCFTGLENKNCRRLRQLIKTEKLLDRQKLQKNSKFELIPERKNPSILDLKDLKKLKVGLRSHFWEEGDKNPDRDLESILCNKMITVSEKYAFKLMPNLIYEIEKIR